MRACNFWKRSLVRSFGQKRQVPGKDTGKESMILRSEMAYELGGDNLPGNRKPDADSRCGIGIRR